MNLFSKISFSKFHYLNLLLALFPLSFIAGNMIININVLMIILATLFLYRERVFQLKFYWLDILIFTYFLLILITAIINDYSFFLEQLEWKGYYSTVIKSLLFLKYLFLYIVVRFVIENKIIHLKYFFIISSISVLFVCFDIVFQLLNGKDIFGFEIEGSGRKLGGPFGDEYIAGGFIQRFSILSFFILPIFYSKLSKRYSKFLIPCLFIIFLLGIILSGNRMPLILFLFATFLIIIFDKRTRKYILTFIAIFSLIFFLFFKFNQEVRYNFSGFKTQISNMIVILLDGKESNVNQPLYLKEFSTFYNTWQMNKFVGGGIKNFRYYCHVRPFIDPNSKFICNMHPHNYYLEILTETGIIGFTIILLIFFNVLFISFFKKYFSNLPLENNDKMIPFIFLFIAEIFPLKSTGSFFTTGNATYIFLILGIIIGLARSNNLIENKF